MGAKRMEVISSFKIVLPAILREKAVSNVKEILDSGMFASGKFVRKCAELIQTNLNIDKVHMMSSGSAALEACAYTLKKRFGVGKVLIPANTFIATSLAFERMGFKVEFYSNGIDKIDFDIPKGYVGIVVVDLGGEIPSDIEVFVEKCHDRGMWVCEDACQAFGSFLGEKQAGTFGDIGAFSFFATKVLTGGEGGAVVVNNPEDDYFVGMYRDFGKESPWVSYHKENGWNCRMNEFGAAILEPQLIYYENIIYDRGLTRLRYRQLLDKTDGLELLPAPTQKHWFNGYKVIAFLNPSTDKNDFLTACEGIKFQGAVYDLILPEQPVYFNKTTTIGTWDYDWKQMICFPTWYGIGSEVEHVVEVVKEALKK